MKKLLTALFVIGSVATLRADYYVGCGAANYGYQQAPSYQPQPQGAPQQLPYGPSTQGAQYQGPYGQSSSGQQFGGTPYANPAYGQQQAGPQAGQKSPAYPYGNPAYQGSAPQGQGQTNDQKLTSQIQDSLQTSKFNNVSAYVNNGYVTLKGTVANPDDKTALEQKVRNLNGVNGVDNQVTVQGSSYSGSNGGNSYNGYSGSNGSSSYGNNNSYSGSSYGSSDNNLKKQPNYKSNY